MPEQHITPDDNPNLSAAARLERQILATPRRRVDAQGKPIGDPITYRYDARGRLISATTPDEAA